MTVGNCPQGLILDLKMRDSLLVPHAKSNERGNSLDVHWLGLGTQHINFIGSRHVGLDADVNADNLNAYRE